MAVLVYLLAVNLLTFAVFAGDKRSALAGVRRTPERLLLQLALIGGSPGAIAAQQLLRHKTRKEPFRSLLWSIAAGQICVVAVIAYVFG